MNRRTSTSLASKKPASPVVRIPKPLASTTDITISARQLAHEALDVVRDIMRGGERITPSLQLKAAQEILDRACGKAPIKVDVTESLSVEEIQALAVEILQENSGLLSPAESVPGKDPLPPGGTPPVP